jgi:hypothetical protein
VLGIGHLPCGSWCGLREQHDQGLLGCILERAYSLFDGNLVRTACADAPLTWQYWRNGLGASTAWIAEIWVAVILNCLSFIVGAFLPRPN